MRYIIETDRPDLISQFKDDEVISEYDPVERLTKRVEKMKAAFDEFKAHRGSWRVMNYYLRGRGVAQSEIDTVLSGVEEFLEQVK